MDLVHLMNCYVVFQSKNTPQFTYHSPIRGSSNRSKDILVITKKLKCYCKYFSIFLCAYV